MYLALSSFDYPLPKERIAQVPVSPRDASRMLLLERNTGKTMHSVFLAIEQKLRSGDILVFNVTKVFRARLQGERPGVEMFVLHAGEGSAEVLLRRGKKFPEGSEVRIAGRAFEVLKKTQDGIVQVKTGMSRQEFLDFCEKNGEIPTPPYVEGKYTDEQYQTVYAKEMGSVAAPTAGLHFTPELISRLRAKGVQIEEVLLHVGIGTFRPVQTEKIEDHVMHAEWVELTQETAQRIVKAKKEGRRIIAVGTTTTRVLEGVAAKAAQEGEKELLCAYTGEINIFITPGFHFRVIDGLLTNFHLPKSTLLMLVSAFAGQDRVLAAYKEAVAEEYRFFSFGDAMLIL